MLPPVTGKEQEEEKEEELVFTPTEQSRAGLAVRETTGTSASHSPERRAAWRGATVWSRRATATWGTPPERRRV